MWTENDSLCQAIVNTIPEEEDMTSDKYDGGGDNQFEDDLNEYSI